MARISRPIINNLIISRDLIPQQITFGIKEIEFIRRVIPKGEVKPNEENIKKFISAERPKMKKCIQSFLGLTEYIPDHLFLITQPSHIH